MTQHTEAVVHHITKEESARLLRHVEKERADQEKRAASRNPNWRPMIESLVREPPLPDKWAGTPSDLMTRGDTRKSLYHHDPLYHAVYSQVSWGEQHGLDIVPTLIDGLERACKDRARLIEELAHLKELQAEGGLTVTTKTEKK